MRVAKVSAKTGAFETLEVNRIELTSTGGGTRAEIRPRSNGRQGLEVRASGRVLLEVE